MNSKIIINNGLKFSYGLSYKKNYKIRRFEPKRYLVVEVKSVYTFNKEKEKNLLKRDSVLNQGINFNFIIL